MMSQRVFALYEWFSICWGFSGIAIIAVACISELVRQLTRRPA